MVKIITERPAQPILGGESVTGVDDGDDGTDWEPDTTTGIPPGTDDGDVLTWDEATLKWGPEPPGSASASGFELNNEGGQDVIKAHGTTGATETIDPTDGNVHTLTLDAHCTITLDAPVGTGAATLVLWVTEDATGGWDIIWPGSVTEDGTHDTTPGTTQRVVLESVDGGGTWLATWTGDSGSALDDLSDVTIIDPADGDIIVYLASTGEWVNVASGGTVGVTSLGSISETGSPQTLIDDAFWNEFPGSVRLDPGRVLVVFRGNGTDHITDGQLCGMIGTLNPARDAVTSWGSKFTILDDADDLRLEDGINIIDGRIVIAYRTFDGADNHLPRLLICDDAPEDYTSASTWGTPIDLPDPGGTVQEYTNGRPHQLSDGSFMQGGGFDSGGNHSVGVWLWPGTIDDPSAATFVVIGSGAGDFQELCVNERPDAPGTIVALLRRGASSTTYYSISTDFGATWSAPASAHDGYGYPMFRFLLSGLALTVYRDGPNGDAMWRVSTDHGITWGSETLLDSVGTRNAYATLLQTTPNDILCVRGTEYSVGGLTGTADLFVDWFQDSSTFGSVGGAPTDVDYLIGTASGDLPSAIVVGTTPGGELGGTWASPTVDGTHSGSAHTDFIAKAIVDAKGDLIAATAADTVARVAVGTDGQYLKADSGATAGVSWVTPSSSGSGVGAILIADTHSTPLVFADLLQTEAQDDLLYADT